MRTLSFASALVFVMLSSACADKSQNIEATYPVEPATSTTAGTTGGSTYSTYPATTGGGTYTSGTYSSGTMSDPALTSSSSTGSYDATYPVTTAPPAGGDETLSVGGGGGRAHTVQKGDTLYSLSRRYYNTPSRWRDIYSANRGVISDPNKLRVGTQLTIP